MQKITGKMGYWERIALELFLEKKTTSLNDFIEMPKRRQFQKMMQLLEKQGVIGLIYPKVTEIRFMGLGNDARPSPQFLQSSLSIPASII